MRAVQPRCEARVATLHAQAPHFTRRCSAGARRAGPARAESLRVCSTAAFDVGVQADSADAAVERACLAWVRCHVMRCTPRMCLTTAAQLDSFVIGMELCPFARSARRGTRVAVCRAETLDAALDALWPEVRRLAGAWPICMRWLCIWRRLDVASQLRRLMRPPLRCLRCRELSLRTLMTTWRCTSARSVKHGR